MGGMQAFSDDRRKPIEKYISSLRMLQTQATQVVATYTQELGVGSTYGTGGIPPATQGSTPTDYASTLDMRYGDDWSVIRFKVYHHFSTHDGEQILGWISLFKKQGISDELTGSKEWAEQLNLAGEQIAEEEQVRECVSSHG